MTVDLRQTFLDLADRQPDVEAILAPGRLPLRFADLPRCIDAVGDALHAAGIGRGDLVATALPNGADAAVCLVTLQCFATVLPLNPGYSDHEFDRYLQRVRPKALVVPDGDGTTARRAAASLGIPVIDLVVDLSQPCGFFALRSDGRGAPAGSDGNRGDDIALVLLTSGSTGQAKLVPVPARVLINYASAMQGYYNLGPADRNLHVMPMFHGHGLKSSLMSPLILGAGVVCPPRFDVPMFFASMEAFRPTWYSAGFTMHRAILDGIDPYRDQAKAARLRFIRSGSGRLDPVIMRGLEEAFDAPVLERYGMSETCTLTYNPPPPAVRKPGTVGIAGKNSVRIVGEDGRVLGPNQEGQVVARGPSVVDGYWDDPKTTAAAFVDGWFQTGDIGRFDEDGYLTITGRIGDLINRGGEKVSPAEIEGELLRHPAVAEVCVFPVPHQTLGQEIAAAVVLRSAGAVDEAGLITHARERLASFKVPRRVAILDELPRAANGKVRRAAMAQLLGLDVDAAAVWRDAGPRTPARSALDIALGSLWASTLGVADVQPDADFFLLGGDSLRAVRLIGQVQEAFGVNLSLADILDQASTLSGMARCIEASRVRAGTVAEHVSAPVNAAARIPRRDTSVPCPMSFQQRRLWFIQRLYPGNPTYNINLAIRMTGPLDVEVLASALNALVARHEALRTTFDVIDGEPCQIVAPQLTIPLPLRDLRERSSDECERETRRILADEVNRSFDLVHGPLLRAVLVRITDQEHSLLMVQHHIVTDAWSRGILHRELSALYDASLQGSESPLPPLAIHYPDYAAWQRQRLSRDRLETLLTYWRRRLADAPVAVSLPTDHGRHGEHDFSGSRMDWPLPAPLVAAFFDLSRRAKTSPYLAWLALFNAFLCRCSGEDDIVVGVPVQGRDRAETLGVIGFFLNMLPVRTDLSGAPSFRELLERVRKAAVADLAHHDLPFERIVEDLQPDRRVGETPLFNTTCILLDRSTRVARPGWHQDIDDFDRGTAPFDLSLALHETDDGHRMTMRFNTAIFERGTVERLMSQLASLMEGVVADPDRRIPEIPLLTPDERRTIVVDWNQTEASYPQNASLQELFEARVDTAPDAVAVSDGRQALTYAELDRRANRLAHLLLETGVGPDVIVGVCLERSAEVVVATLAIVKAGGAYLPLDTAYPDSRKQFMLANAGAALLLTTTSQLSASAGWPTAAVCLDVVAADLERRSTSRPSPRATGDDLAYVIYTSGSTGQPKGVAVRQRSVTRLVINTNYLPFSPATVIAQLSNVAFDAATFELWGALLSGGRLEILEDDTVLQPDRLAAAIAERGITAMFLTTALFNELARTKPDTFQGLDRLLVGGEMADPNAFRLVLETKPPAHLIHMYGPTEATTFATYHEVAHVPLHPTSIPIGRPISNTRLYVLGADMNPVPVGCQGEIYVAGPGVARGYVGLPELTAERFVPDLFSNRPGDVLYKTGDRARYRADGTIDILGRVDRQIKLRGFRIEPGEIESALTRHPHVAAAVVMVEGEGTHRHLVGYVTTRSELTPPSELRAFLRGTLPDFMVPDAFVWLDRLPLTPSGKIDRSAIGGDRQRERRPATAAPRTPTERIVADIWAEQLKLPSVGIDDNFFERGGHSLLAVNLIAALETRFGIPLSPALLFEAPTVMALARKIDDRTAPQQSTRLVPVQTQGSHPPIFAVPGGGGSVIAYAQLSRELGRNQPFYGLEHQRPEGGDVPPDRVEAVANSFLQELRNLHPGQPCVVLGACSGAVVAFELARLLTAEGRPVARVIMLDPAKIGPRRSPVANVPGWQQLAVPRFIATRLGLYVRDMRRLAGPARRQFLKEKGQRLGQLLRDRQLFRESARDLNRLRLRDATVRALHKYSPRPYGAPVTLIVGTRFHSAEHAKSIEPWREVCTGPLEIHHIAVETSGEMLRPPAIGELVRQLTQSLYGAEGPIAAAAPPSPVRA